MTIIKNAIIYVAELPPAAELEKHLQARTFHEPGALDWQSNGFVPVPAGDGELVTKYPEGFAFSWRVDKKILPRTAIRAQANKLRDKIEHEEARKVGRKEFKLLMEQAADDLLPRAISKTVAVTVYYDTARQYLIVPVASKATASEVMSSLIHAVGSVKTTTINISDPAMGLSAHLHDWLADKEAFGDELQPTGTVRLADGKESVSYKVDSPESVHEGIKEAFERGFKVKELGMSSDDTLFRLTDKFHFKGISHAVKDEPQGDSLREAWEATITLEVLELRRIIDALGELLGYQQAPEEKQAA